MSNDDEAALAEKPTEFGMLDPYATARQAAGTPRPLLADMITALDYESARMAQSQRALVASGLRADYHAEEMRRIACIEAAMDLLGRIRANVMDWPESVQKVIKGEALAPRKPRA